MKKALSLQILVPTYNRAHFLGCNLHRLGRQIYALQSSARVSVVISDNSSSDNTADVVSDFIGSYPEIVVVYLRNERNIGLEGNIVNLLKHADSDFILFLGDDDFLAENYIERVIGIMREDEDVTLIVPGYAEVFADGGYENKRIESFTEKKFPAGPDSLIFLSCYAHQMSGLTFRRKGLLESYSCRQDLRNIYPFIHFACHSILSGSSYLLPAFSTLVWCSNEKDWRYDESGLLTEIFKNYRGLLGGLVQARAQIACLLSQPWRMRLSYRRPQLYLRAMFHVWRSDTPHALTKMFLLVLPFWLLGARYFRTKPLLIREMRPDVLNDLGLSLGG